MENKKKKFTVVHLSILIAVIAIVALFGVLTTVVYTNPTGSIARTSSSILPYPAMVINWSPISVNKVLDQHEGLMTYYTSGMAEEFGITAPTEAEALNNILDNLIRKKVMNQMIKQRGLAYDLDLENDFLDKAIAQAGSTEAFTDMLEESFGWDTTDFIEYIIEPFVIASVLEDDILYDSELQAEKKAEIDDAYSRLLNGEDFATIATVVSDDASSESGGQIGLFAQEELPEEWGSAIFELESGQYSEVIETRFAYGLFYVESYVEEEDVLKADISIIGIQKVGLQEVVEEEMAQAKIWQLIEM
ncbi:MAG: peptidylprolyl isomerase [Candidatus Uhrbacteria bacterium]